MLRRLLVELDHFVVELISLLRVNLDTVDLCSSYRAMARNFRVSLPLFEVLDLALDISDFLLKSVVLEELVAQVDAKLVVKPHLQGSLLFRRELVLASRLGPSRVRSLIESLFCGHWRTVNVAAESSHVFRGLLSGGFLKVLLNLDSQAVVDHFERRVAILALLGRVTIERVINQIVLRRHLRLEICVW